MRFCLIPLISGKHPIMIGAHMMDIYKVLCGQIVHSERVCMSCSANASLPSLCSLTSTKPRDRSTRNQLSNTVFESGSPLNHHLDVSIG